MMMNNFFASVFTADDGSEMPQLNQMYHGQYPLKDITITEEDVLSAIQKLRSDTAPGPDNIYSRNLKELAKPGSTSIIKDLHVLTDNWCSCFRLETGKCYTCL